MMSMARPIEALLMVGCCGVGRPWRTSWTPPLRSRPRRVGFLAMTTVETRIRPRTKRRTKRFLRCLPIVSGLGREDDQQSSVVVIGGEDVGHRLSGQVSLGVDGDLLAQRAHPPLQRCFDRV